MKKNPTLLNERNPTNDNAEKLKKTLSEQTKTYQKQHLEYFQDQIKSEIH